MRLCVCISRREQEELLLTFLGVQSVIILCTHRRTPDASSRYPSLQHTPFPKPFIHGRDSHGWRWCRGRTTQLIPLVLLLPFSFITLMHSLRSRNVQSAHRSWPHNLPTTDNRNDMNRLYWTTYRHHRPDQNMTFQIMIIIIINSQKVQITFKARLVCFILCLC